MYLKQPGIRGGHSEIITMGKAGGFESGLESLLIPNSLWVTNQPVMWLCGPRFLT